MSGQTPPEKAADSKKMMIPYLTQEEAKYDANGGTLNPRTEACSTCRFFRERDGLHGTPGGYECAIVESWPAPIVSNGWCEWFAKRPPYEPDPMPVVIVEVETDGEMQMSAREPGEYIRTPPMNIIAKGKTVPATPKQTLIRDKAGRRYMFIVTSNGYKDREDEWIPAAELKSYVDSCWIDEKTFHSDNPLLFWHDKRLKAGDIIWADMDGPFLIELAREGDTSIAKALWDYREANPGDELWGASHGFRYQQRSADGVYAGIRKKETSFLPLWAAANSLTASEVLTVMSEKSRNEYVNNLFKTFGVDNAADLLRTGTQTLTDKLAAAGVQSKSADGTPAQQPLISKEAAALIVEMVDAQKDMLDRLEAIETKQKEAPAIPPELQTQLNTIGAAVRQIQATLELKPTQASKDANTVVDPKTDTDAAKAAAELEKKQVGQFDPFYGDMNVPTQP